MRLELHFSRGRPTGTELPLTQWPEHLPVPRAGDEIEFPDGANYTVERVVWFPMASEDDPPSGYIMLKD